LRYSKAILIPQPLNLTVEKLVKNIYKIEGLEKERKMVLVVWKGAGVYS
jgi:hypothetical protein